MAFIHDIIKIKYSRLGYLPSFPYHMISDREMFDAFIGISENSSDNPIFFDDYYANPFADEDVLYEKLDKNGVVTATISLSAEYIKLKQYIKTAIVSYLDSDDAVLPDWVYTYMLGEVVGTKSEYYDIYDTLALMQSNNLNNEFMPSDCAKCYDVSLRYISTLTSGIRPPTVFGEPHVIKQLRLEA